MKIFVDENIPQGLEAFSKFGEVIPFAGRLLKKEQLVEAQAEALIVRSITKVNADLLQGTAVKFVATATIGTDHFDESYLKKNHITYAASPGCNANAVGEYFTSALTWLHAEKGYSLEGKVLGIIGYGHVGKNVAAKAKALGLEVLLCDPPLAEIDPSPFSPLSTLLEKADILTLHVPLTRSGPYPTLKMANADFFSQLKKPIALINTCRGEVIDPTAFLQAYTEQKFKHIIFDVFYGEPNVDPNIATKCDLITSHIAGYSLHGKLNGTTQVAAAFRKYFGFTKPWTPKYPSPVDAIIAYPAANLGTVSDEVFLYQCIQKAYPIQEDDARLRPSYGANYENERAAKTFDRLRKEYPIRHEFSEYKISHLPKEKSDLRDNLLALGFSVI